MDRALCGSCASIHATRFSCDKGVWNEVGCQTVGLDALETIDCTMGAACLAGTSCGWFGSGQASCSCDAASSTMACAPSQDSAMEPCVEGGTCFGESAYCVVRNEDCGRKCTCEGGTYHCESHCSSGVCAQGQSCVSGDTCTATSGDCTTSCTCQADSRLDCQTTCPSCPDANQACGSPCDKPSTTDACLCVDGSQKVPCNCGAPSGGSPRLLCCPTGVNPGDSCDGFPDGKICGRSPGSEGACSCQAGVWSSCSF